MAIELSNEVLSTFVPIVIYWVLSGIYELLAYYMEGSRLHPKSEENEKNIPSRGQVLKSVLLQQLGQIIVVFSILKFISDDNGTPKPEPSILQIAYRFLIAMVVLDSWQYFGHRYMHINKFLYKHMHSKHHTLLVPYAYGALYGHPIEGLILDTIGGSLAFLLSGMSPRTSIYFFSFVTIKAVDVHCSLWLPWNPLQFLFGNNCAFHEVHHQLRGSKFNYAQPLFISWDKICGTHMPYDIVERVGGGYEVRPVKIKN